MVDTGDLKSPDFGRAGSSPALATNKGVNNMSYSNRDIERLYDKYNPNNIRSGDRVRVAIGKHYLARVVGLHLDIKNKKLYADLRLLDNSKNNPTRVDVSDCHLMTVIYPGHHNNT